jgi:hypothetical protein
MRIRVTTTQSIGNGVGVIGGLVALQSPVSPFQPPSL